MWFGLFVGVMLSFFSTTGGYFSIVTSVLMGAAFFMLFGIVTYAMQRGKRDFTSTSQVVATNYDVVVSFEAANEARRLLHQLPMTPHDASGAAGSAGYAQRDYQHQPYQPAVPSRARSSPASRARRRSAPRAGTTPTASGRPEAGGQQPGRAARPAAGAGPARRARRPPAGSGDTAAGDRSAARPARRVRATRTCPTAARSTGSASRDAPKPEPGQDGPQQLTQQQLDGNAEGLRPDDPGGGLLRASGCAAVELPLSYGVWPSASW